MATLVTTNSTSGIVRKIDVIETAWETLASEDSFAGMTLQGFRETVAPAITSRETASRLRSELRSNVAATAEADANARETIARVVAGVLASSHHGKNSALYRAMGYKTADERSSGLSRPTPAPTPAP